MIKSYLFDIVSPIVINILILSLDYGSNMKSRKFTTSHSRHQQSTRLILHTTHTYLFTGMPPSFLHTAHRSKSLASRQVCMHYSSFRSLDSLLYPIPRHIKIEILESSKQRNVCTPSSLQLSMQIITNYQLLIE